MHQINVSVVIPVYNAAHCMAPTLDSLRNQTMDPNNFEVIFVDNCSTDNSLVMIREFAKTLPHVVVIAREQNSGGPFLSMNQGLEAARGKYVHFLDSDDFFGDEALQRLYDAAERNGSDITIGKVISVNDRFVPNIIFARGSRRQADLLNDNLLYALTPHKLFRRSLLMEHNIRFYTVNNMGNEDQLFTVQCYLVAKKVTIMADYDYYYWMGMGNQSFSFQEKPAAKFFYVATAIMEELGNKIADADRRHATQLVFLKKFFKTTRLRKILMHENYSEAQKADYLALAKIFVRNHVSAALLQELPPQMQQLCRDITIHDVSYFVARPQLQAAA